MMQLHCLLIIAFSACVVNIITANSGHDLFLKETQYHELEVQIRHMHKKLYEKCPKVFHALGSASVPIIGRRRSVEATLDLKIELAEKTLENLIMEYQNCTSTTTKTTAGTITEKRTIPTLTSTEIRTPRTSTKPTTNPVVTTTNQHQHAFQVLRSKNITYSGYDFLALEVRVPTNGLSKSPNWCYDYQYLCEEFHRRPTGCGSHWRNYSVYTSCRDKYYSDMNNGDTLGCNPADGIARLTNIAYPNLRPRAFSNNAFGFQQCQYCAKTIQGSEYALSYMRDFWISKATTFYTVCR